MNLKIVKTIFQKELLDTLRDRRTLFAMIGIPIILYPALFLVGTQVAVVQMGKIEQEISTVAVTGLNTAALMDLLSADEFIDVIDSEEPSVALSDGSLDAIVRIEADPDEALNAEGSVPVNIEFDFTEPSSRKAASRVEEVFAVEAERLLSNRIIAHDLPATFAIPFDVEQNNVAPPAKTTGFILGMTLPILMVVMLGVGAFYPAVDLTAGEKERGTFETLLSTPTSKLEIVAGKFLAVFTLSIITGFLNLASIVATLAFQFSQFVDQAGEELQEMDLLSLSPASMFAIVAILVPLAFFISAVMMTVALFAKSFKDAQNIVTPFFLAIILPATIGVIPEIKLSATTQFIPIGNVTLLFRDLMKGTATVESVFIVFLCTSIYALLSLVIATWMFQREEVILSEEKGVPFSFRRSSFIPRPIPTPGLSLVLFATVMLLLFYGGAYAQSKDIHIGLLVTQYLLIAAPVIGILWFARIDVKKSLMLFRPPPLAFAGALLLLPGWAILTMQVGVWQGKILPIPPELEEAMAGLLLRDGNELSIIVLLFIVAVSPAICEELLFRGAMLSGLRDKLPAWGTILLIGTTFGLFHLSVYRVVPTGLSGLLLAYIALRSGSIFPAMFAHFLLNASLILLQTNTLPQGMITYLEGLSLEEHGFPITLLLGGVISLAVGIAVVELGARRSVTLARS